MYSPKNRGGAVMRLSYYLILILLLPVPDVLAIPWPLGTGDPAWEGIFPITRTFGNFDENGYWVLVDDSWDDYSFHNAIDIKEEDAGTEEIRSVQTGVYTFVEEQAAGSDEYCVHVFKSGATVGFHFGHVQGTDGVPRPLNQVTPGVHVAMYGDKLGTMAEITGKHLHFYCTDQHEFHNGDPGIDNPLDYIDTEYAPTQANGYVWDFDTPDQSMFYLPQCDAISLSSGVDWKSQYNPPTPGSPVNPLAVQDDMLNELGLYGSVDFFLSVQVEGYPQGSPIDCSGIPHSIEWELFRYMPYGYYFSLFSRYLVEFDGEIGNAPGDWQEFRRLYFPFFAEQLGFYGADGPVPVVCLTNCSSNQGFDGIGNIEENCFQTNLHQCGSGDATTPSNSMYPDGPYQVEATVAAFDGTEETITNDFLIDNWVPVIMHVTVYNGSLSSKLYEGEWQDLPEDQRELLETTYGYLSESVDEEIIVKIGVSERLDPDNMPEIWLEGFWAGETKWFSNQQGIQYEFQPSLDPVDLPDQRSDLVYYLYSTTLGITDYHGQLSLNIGPGYDLSGNLLDGDPSSAVPIKNGNGEFSQDNYEDGEVDDSYDWEMSTLGFSRPDPESSTVYGNVGVGSSAMSFEVQIPSSRVNDTFWGSDGLGSGGCCPYAHGFWLVAPLMNTHEFRVTLVDFEGEILGTFTREVPFMFRFPEGGELIPNASSIYEGLQFLSGPDWGNFCWVGVRSSIFKHREKLMPEYQVPSYSWITVYAFNPVGGSSDHPLAQGEDADLYDLARDLSDVNCAIATYRLDEVYYNVTLNPPVFNPENDFLRVPAEGSFTHQDASIGEEMSFGLSLSPNPANSEVFAAVELDQSGSIELQIIDLSGRIVESVAGGSFTAGSHSFSAAIDLPSGVYFMQLTSGDRIDTEKLVVAR